jgi:NDP-sugar pyrophosphorylase family protein
MQVVVLAGGLGTRLRPLTNNLPKCMVRVAGQPFLFYLLRLLKARGTDDIIICTGFLGEQVEEYFRDGNRIGRKLRYSREGNPLLGTGGALKRALPLFRDSFLVVNGDTFINLDYSSVYAGFLKSGTEALIVASHRGTNSNSHCDLALNTGGMVRRYDKSSAGMDYVNVGVMAFRKRVFDNIQPTSIISLECDVFPELISRHQVQSVITTHPFFDIGTFAGLDAFEKSISEAVH